MRWVPKAVAGLVIGGMCAFQSAAAVDWRIKQYARETWHFYGVSDSLLNDTLSEPSSFDPPSSNITWKDYVGAAFVAEEALALFAQAREDEAWDKVQGYARDQLISRSLNAAGFNILNGYITFGTLLYELGEAFYNIFHNLAIKNQIWLYNYARDHDTTDNYILAGPNNAVWETGDGIPIVWDDRGWFNQIGQYRANIYPQILLDDDFFIRASVAYDVRHANIENEKFAIGSAIQQAINERLFGQMNANVTGARVAPAQVTYHGTAVAPQSQQVTGYEWRTTSGTLLGSGPNIVRDYFTPGGTVIRGKALFSGGGSSETDIPVSISSPRVTIQPDPVEEKRATFRVHESPLIQAVSWNFGDGTTGSGTSVVKTYAQYGNYQVRASITATNGSVLNTAPVTFGAGIGGPTRINYPYTITTTERWHSYGSPYILDRDVTIAPGGRLILEPGTIIKFGGRDQWNNPRPSYLQVNGTLEFAGTTDDRAVIMSQNDDSIGGDVNGDGAVGSWGTGGISLNPGGSVLGSGGFLKEGMVLYGQDGALNLSNMRVQGTISLYDAASPRLNASTFEGIGAYFQQCSSPVVTTNEFRDGGTVSFFQCSSPTVSNNLSKGGTSAFTPVMFDRCRGTITVTGNTAQDFARPAVSVYEMGDDLRLTKSTWAYLTYGYEPTTGGSLPVFRVPLGKTLTLDPGVVVKGDREWWTGRTHGYRVYGTLNAVGTPAEPVILTTYADDTVLGDSYLDGVTSSNENYWNLVGEAGRLNLRYADLRQTPFSSVAGSVVEVRDSTLTRSGLTCQGSIPTLERNFFDQSGVQITAAPTPPTVSGNTFKQAGVNFSDCPSPVAMMNEFRDGGTVFVSQCSSPTVTNNLFTGGTSAFTPVYLYLCRGTITMTGNTVLDFARPAATVYEMGDDLRLTKSNWAYLTIGYEPGQGGSLPVFRVPLGKTLTLDPGVVVKGDREYWQGRACGFRAYGTLNAVGTPSEPVIITTFADDSVLGDSYLDGTSTAGDNPWNLVGEVGRLNVRHADVRQFPFSSVAGSVVEVRDSTLTRSGLSCNGSIPTLERNFFDRSEVAITAAPTPPTVSGNIFKQCSVYFADCPSPVATMNEFRDFATVYVHQCSSPTVTNNLFKGGTGAFAPVRFDLCRGTITVSGNTVQDFARPAISVYNMGGDLRLTKSQWAYLVTGYGWTPEGNREGFNVPAGKTLTLEPGVVIKPDRRSFMSYYPIMQVVGRVDALATQQDPIILTRASDHSALGNSGLWPETGDYGHPQIIAYSGSRVNFGGVIVRGGQISTRPNAKINFSRTYLQQTYTDIYQPSPGSGITSSVFVGNQGTWIRGANSFGVSHLTMSSDSGLIFDSSRFIVENSASIGVQTGITSTQSPTSNPSRQHHNLFWNCLYNLNGIAPDATDIVADPQFEFGSFKPMSNSPLVRSASSDPDVCTFDFWGYWRDRQSGADRGAIQSGERREVAMFSVSYGDFVPNSDRVRLSMTSGDVFHPDVELPRNTDSVGFVGIPFDALQRTNIRFSASGFLSAVVPCPTDPNVLASVEMVNGDCTRDNVINARDLKYVTEAASVAGSRNPYDPIADVNADGRVDRLDIEIVRKNQGLYGK